MSIGDQNGSRVIQQKLETATTKEKNMVVEEFHPQALTLMTDVFVNYAIQKVFYRSFPESEVVGVLLSGVVLLV